MRIYKVGIIGHHPERFRDVIETKRACEDTLALIQYQYENQNKLLFNLGGEIGAEQWFGTACIARNADFSLFLPCSPEIMSKYWYDDQKEELQRQVDHCSGLTLLAESWRNKEHRESLYEAKSQIIVDNSDFLVCFWEGRLFGQTFETIKYAIDNSKIVLNGLTGLSLVIRSQLEK